MMRVAIFDTETTGVPDKHGPMARVVEVAAVAVDWAPDGTVVPVDTWASLVRPKGGVHRLVGATRALELNHLTVEQIDTAPPEAYVGQVLEAWLVGLGVQGAAAYNNEFDFHTQLLGSGFLLGRWLRCVYWLPCLMEATHAKVGHDRYTPGGGLGPMCKRLGVALDDAHTALADAKAAAKLLPMVLTYPDDWEPITLPRCPMRRP